MPSRLVNGAQFAISTVLAAAVPITAISNASPPVATTASPPALNAVTLLTSGWPSLTGRVVRAGSPLANSFTLLGLNTVDVSQYQPGEGAGVFQVASGFIGLSKVVQVAKSGGEQNFATRQYIEDPTGTQVQFPTYKSAISFQMELDYDPSLPWFAALVELNRTRGVTVLREVLPGGDTILYPGTVSFDDVPSKSVNEVMGVTATFSLTAPPIRYAA